MKVASTLGKGSCFSLQMPTVAPAPATPKVDDAMPAKMGRHGAQVLCIDNDRPSCEGLVALLGRWGFDAIGVQHPNQVPTDCNPAIIILDYRLDDGLTGDHAAAMLAQKLGDLPPIILLTAEDTDETQRAADSINAQRLIKPANPAAMRALIGSIL